jgi:hypothetical protein
MPLPLAAVVNVSGRVAGTSSRLAKRDAIAALLRSAPLRTGEGLSAGQAGAGGRHGRDGAKPVRGAVGAWRLMRGPACWDNPLHARAKQEHARA